jgi:hypothetical protein
MGEEEEYGFWNSRSYDSLLYEEDVVQFGLTRPGVIGKYNGFP